jgi:NAD(P)-dependent dehydrogenase (short-subunit alcohol dehydrogenase family)
MEIKDTTAIITGGASGLGEATVRAIVEAGGRVAILDMDQERGRGLTEELGGSAQFFAVDICQEKAMEEAVAKIKAALGNFQVVINCAGVGGAVKVVGKEGVMPLELFNRTIRINLIGTFNVIRASAASLMANPPNEEGERGVYINTASIAACDGQIGQAAYSSSKGGVVSLTLTLAREFAAHGIRVMAILPGIMHTPMLAKLEEKVRERLGFQVPFPARLGKPSEFASLACHIIRNPYLNGEFIRLDGALRMGFGRK